METRVLLIWSMEEGNGIVTLAETIVPVLERQVDLQYLPTARRRPYTEAGKISLKNIAGAVTQYVRFLRILLHFRPHIIHLHTSEGLGWLKDTFYVLVGKACRSYVIIHVHAADFDKLYGKQAQIVQSYTRMVMRLADAVIALSEEWRRRLEQIVSVDRIFIFRNCIAVDEFSPDLTQRPPKGAKALFLGTVGPRKGAFDLLEVMGYLKSKNTPLHLWVAGYEQREGDLARARCRLEELQIGDTCQFMGSVRGIKKAQLLKEASLLVLPSYNEGLPMAILEAMAAGLAVVASPVGGIPEVVRDGYNGFLVAPRDISSLAEKLALLAGDRQLCELMGKRGREIAEQELDVKPYVARLVELYGLLLN